MKKNYTNLKAFVERAASGEQFVYHTGVLASDRKNDDTLEDTAQEAMKYYQAGRVELMQRKLKPNRYEYVAVRQTEIAQRKFKGCYA